MTLSSLASNDVKFLCWMYASQLLDHEQNIILFDDETSTVRLDRTKDASLTLKVLDVMSAGTGYINGNNIMVQLSKASQLTSVLLFSCSSVIQWLNLRL